MEAREQELLTFCTSDKRTQKYGSGSSDTANVLKFVLIFQFQCMMRGTWIFYCSHLPSGQVLCANHPEDDERLTTAKF